MNPFLTTCILQREKKNLTKSRFRDEEQYAKNMNAILIAITDLESKKVKYYFLMNSILKAMFFFRIVPMMQFLSHRKQKLSQDADASMNQTKS